MSFTIVAMLAFSMVTVAAGVTWAIVKRDTSLNNIEKNTKVLQSFVFYGLVIGAIVITFYYS